MLKFVYAGASNIKRKEFCKRKGYAKLMCFGGKFLGEDLCIFLKLPLRCKVD